FWDDWIESIGNNLEEN
ncbi:unnamed protein product, partial [Rotaria magnacalcarata]